MSKAHVLAVRSWPYRTWIAYATLVLAALAWLAIADIAAPPRNQAEVRQQKETSASTAGITKVADDLSGGSLSTKLVHGLAARYRLTAERDGASELKLPASFGRLSWNAATIAANEQRLFDSRRSAFESQQKDLRLRIRTVHEEIEGFERQRKAKEEEIEIIREELRVIEPMHRRQLANVPRLLNLKRELTRAHWDMGSLDAAVARSRLAIKELEQQLNEMRHNVITDADREIRDIDLEISTLAAADESLPRSLVNLVRELQATQQRRNGVRPARY